MYIAFIFLIEHYRHTLRHLNIIPDYLVRTDTFLFREFFVNHTFEFLTKTLIKTRL